MKSPFKTCCAILLCLSAIVFVGASVLAQDPPAGAPPAAAQDRPAGFPGAAGRPAQGIPQSCESIGVG